MPDLVKMLRDLADAYEREEREERAGEASKATETRIEQLEALVAKASSSEKSDAIEELTDDEWALIEEHRGGKREKPEPPEVKEEKEERKRRRQRVSEQMPQIWSGDDEADIVEYEDEEGNVKVRKGRKKGMPTADQVEEIEDGEGRRVA